MSPRNPFEPRPVVGRRGGRIKEPLSHDAIVSTALELLMQGGLERMSLRKVAAALDTGPTSLYVYVESLEALQALVLDRALAGVDTAGQLQREWRPRLIALIESYVTVLMRSPGLAQLAMTRIAAGPNALRFYEHLLAILQEAGVEAARAAWAVDLISLYATAIAAEQSQRQGQKNPLAHVTDGIRAEQHPHLHAVREQMVSGTGTERFMWAIDVLLQGILETPRPPERRPSPESTARPRSRAPRPTSSRK